jgi:hypothetical protein
LPKKRQKKTLRLWRNKSSLKPCLGTNCFVELELSFNFLLGVKMFMYSTWNVTQVYFYFVQKNIFNDRYCDGKHSTFQSEHITPSQLPWAQDSQSRNKFVEYFDWF